MTWLEISAAAAALAIVVLSVFAAAALLEMKAAMRQIRGAVQEAQQSLKQTADQSEQLLQAAHGAAEEVRVQLQMLQGCLHSIHMAGSAIGEVAAILKRASRLMDRSLHGAEKVVHTHQQRLADALEWATTGMELWQRWQMHRQAKPGSTEPESHN